MYYLNCVIGYFSCCDECTLTLIHWLLVYDFVLVCDRWKNVLQLWCNCKFSTKSSPCNGRSPSAWWWLYDCYSPIHYAFIYTNIVFLSLSVKKLFIAHSLIPSKYKSLSFVCVCVLLDREIFINLLYEGKKHIILFCIYRKFRHKSIKEAWCTKEFFLVLSNFMKVLKQVIYSMTFCTIILWFCKHFNEHLPFISIIDSS